MFSISLILVAVNVVFSVLAFSRPELMARYQFNAYMISHRNQWYRFITHAFLHADWIHLIVNMFVLWQFGSLVENRLAYHFGEFSSGIYLLLYFSSLIISSISTYVKHKNDHWYNAVGASGAVSAVMFSSVVFIPFMQIALYGIIPLPALIWAILYLAYSAWSGRRANDNVNHEAHLWGAIYGLIFTLLLSKDIAREFINQITFALR